MTDLETFMTLEEVCAAAGNVHFSTIYRWIDNGTFPPARRLGPNTVRWPLSEVVAWQRGEWTKKGKAA